MPPYQFQSEDFALSEAGIHLLRNKFNFKTISYDEVTKATLLRSQEIKRPLIILCPGIAMLCFSIKQSLWVFGLFNDPQVFHIYIESIVLPVIPGFLGIYCVASALRKGPVLKLEDGKTTYKLRLRSIYKSNQVPEFKQYLGAKLRGGKLWLDSTFHQE